MITKEKLETFLKTNGLRLSKSAVETVFYDMEATIEELDKCGFCGDIYHQHENEVQYCEELDGKACNRCFVSNEGDLNND